MIRFEELGEAVARVQDADREALRDQESASQSYIRRLRQRQQAPSRTLWLAAAAVFALTVGVSLFWIRKSAAPSGVPALAALPTGRPIVAPVDHGIPLNFPDGSRVQLESGAKANVVELTAQGATLELQSGKAVASVIHRANTRWSLRAGPYRVAVTGTKFALEWVPNQSHFELTLNEGSVVVTTDNSSHGAVTMRSPESLVIDGGEWHLSSQLQPAAKSDVPSDPSVSVEAPRAVERAAAANPSSTNPKSSRSSEAASNVPEWQHLAQLGKYADAYAAAQQTGVSNLAQSVSGQSMLVLAEICRFTGHASESISVLTKLRQRFTGSDEAAIAAFQLGRLSSDGHLAATWFQSYLRERPSGDLAREASGRVLEALDRSGDHAGAVKAAEQYLRRYPAGPHAKFARQLTSQ